MKPGVGWLWLAVAFLAGAASLLVLLGLDPEALRGRLESPSRPLAELGKPPARLTYHDAVARAGPAVLNIFSAKVTTEHREPPRDRYLKRYYGPFLPERTRRRHAVSLGSGVILSADGLILTNRHIVEGAEAIRVELATGDDLDVEVLGLDPETDLAVLRADAAGLPVIPVGRPDDLRVGDVVLAIGNPYGMGQTVTMGIVSATRRSQLGITAIEDFIQTDASINPGNSGGALVNAGGEIVGINTAIYSQSGGSEGVGFAISIDLALDVMAKMLAEGRVARGWIGIEGRTVTPQLAQSFGLRSASGVLVDRTLEDGPAAEAGLRPGDVITGVGDLPVESTQGLTEAVASAGPGAHIVLDVWRGSRLIRAHATTGARPLVASQ
jgi:serine protease DegS